MVRIFLPLIMAVVAFLGPWLPSGDGAFMGSDSANATIDCFLDLELSVTGACAPAGSNLGQQLVGYTVLGGAAAAVLSIVGLLPFIGRLTSIGVIGAGAVGVVASVMALLALTGPNALGFTDIGWGAYATLAVGLITMWSGLDGMRHGNE
ncbi:MAG: hypothetical protein AAF830_04040 [Pseudomonadota bacterium]